MGDEADKVKTAPTGDLVQVNPSGEASTILQICLNESMRKQPE